MYGRDYFGRTVRFEPSGGLVGSSLVMQDKETDSYWSIMEGKAVAGELSGTKLVELPLGDKMQWRHWRERYPDTLVLSVNGREDASNGYAEYFQSPRGMFGEAKDDRLRSKAPVFAFRHGDLAYAVVMESVEDGRVLDLPDGSQVFLHRERRASMFRATDAYVSRDGFERRGEDWVEKRTGARFDADRGVFGDDSVAAFFGVDTFWYTWSLNNPGTELIP